MVMMNGMILEEYFGLEIKTFDFLGTSLFFWEKVE